MTRLKALSKTSQQMVMRSIKRKGVKRWMGPSEHSKRMIMKSIEGVTKGMIEIVIVKAIEGNSHWKTSIYLRFLLTE